MGAQPERISAKALDGETRRYPYLHTANLAVCGRHCNASPAHFSPPSLALDGALGCTPIVTDNIVLYPLHFAHCTAHLTPRAPPHAHAVPSGTRCCAVSSYVVPAAAGAFLALPWRVSSGARPCAPPHQTPLRTRTALRAHLLNGWSGAVACTLSQRTRASMFGVTGRMRAAHLFSRMWRITAGRHSRISSRAVTPAYVTRRCPYRQRACAAFLLRRFARRVCLRIWRLPRGVWRGPSQKHGTWTRLLSLHCALTSGSGFRINAIHGQW